MQNSIRVVELAGHIQESKNSVRYYPKRAYLIYIFQTPIKNKCFEGKWVFFIDTTIESMR